MAIVTSRAGAIIDAFIAKLNASATFADPVQVYDGPVTSGSTMYDGGGAVYVGFDGDWRSDAAGRVAAGVSYSAALINQQMIYVGNTSVREEVEVPCCVTAWSGDPTCKTARNTVMALLAGVETIIRTDPTLGIDGSTIAELRLGDLYYEFDEGGNMNAHVPFTIHVVTTLLSV